LTLVFFLFLVGIGKLAILVKLVIFVDFFLVEKSSNYLTRVFCLLRQDCQVWSLLTHGWWLVEYNE
jgi:hypothetical protein